MLTTNPSIIRYAGFLRRAGALIIDLMFIWLIAFVINYVYGYICGVEARAAGALQTQEIIVRLDRFALLSSWAILFLYFALFESSALQATPGKLLFKIKVRDRQGRISFARALARTAAKLLSAITLGAGFVMPAFTRRKQALHDFIANTEVIKDN